MEGKTLLSRPKGAQRGWRSERVGDVGSKTSLSRPEDAAVWLKAREGWEHGRQDITVKARQGEEHFLAAFNKGSIHE